MTARTFASRNISGWRLATIAGAVLAVLCMVAASTQAAPTTEGVTLCVKKRGVRKGTIRFPRVNATCKSTERTVVLVSSTDLTVLESLIGKAGEKGPQGEPGPEGLQGPVGLQGPEGEEGPEGKQGPEGDEGPEGKEGPQGKQGPEGKEGPEGKQGPEGDKGPEGKEGPEGVEGSQGPEGEEGPEGKQGPQGKQGPEGEKGPTGDKGPEGKEGPEGKQGPEGPQGPSGGAEGEIRGGGGDSTVADGMGNRFFGPSIDIFSEAETAIQEVLTSGGTVSNLRVYLTGAPGPGNKYTFTVRRDPAGNAAPESTSISCSMNGNGVGSTTCESSATQKFEAGDAISILATESGSPTTRSMFFRLDYQP